MVTIGEFHQQKNLEDLFFQVESECIKSFSTLLSQRHDELGYLNMRRLYTLTKGQSAIHINKSIGNLYPSGDQSIQSKAICERILKGGGYFCDKLYGYEKDMDDLCKMIDEHGHAAEGSKRSRLTEWNTLKQNRLVREISQDPIYRQVADEYLGCKSILNRVTAWKTSHVNVDAPNRLGDAMMFHFDYDHNRFLKIFVYLSDVDETCGPHVYIENTHAALRFNLPEPLHRDGRLTSLDVINCGLVPRYALGKRGTIIFGDTTNLHKGTPVGKNKSRYILQVQFADSIFGAKRLHSVDDLIDMNKGVER